jgi:hypothetical protein
VAGGCIHRAWRLEGRGGQPLFIKTNRASALPLLQAEAEAGGAGRRGARHLHLVQHQQTAGMAGEKGLGVLELPPGRGQLKVQVQGRGTAPGRRLRYPLLGQCGLAHLPRPQQDHRRKFVKQLDQSRKYGASRAWVG